MRRIGRIGRIGRICRIRHRILIRRKIKVTNTIKTQ